MKSPNLTISESNAPAICAVGALLFWLVFVLPAVLDVSGLLGNPGGFKSSIPIACALWGGFCGTAFYLCLAGSVARGLWKRFPSRPWRTLLLTFWILLPLGPIAFADFVILGKMSGNL